MNSNHPVFNEYLEILKKGNKSNIFNYLQIHFETIQAEVSGQSPDYDNQRVNLMNIANPTFKNITTILFKFPIYKLHNEYSHYFTDFIKENNLVLVELLLRRGYNPNCPRENFLIRQLTQKGYNTSKVVILEKLPLEIAIESNNIPMIKLLLQSPFIQIRDNLLEIASTSPEILTLLQGRKNTPLPKNRPVFFYQGHGLESCDSSTGKLISKTVPNNSLYVLTAICGSPTSNRRDHLIRMMNDRYDIILQNPVQFKKEIESSLSRTTNKIQIAIYSPGMEFIDNIFFPADIHEISNNLKIDSSGLLNNTEILKNNVDFSSASFNLPLADFKQLLPFFKGSIYPTIQQLQDKLDSMKPETEWTVDQVNNFFHNFNKPASAILEEHPGVHYNLLCRYVRRKDSSCVKASLARRISSVEERGRNLIYTLQQAYRFDDEDTFIQFLMNNYDLFHSRLTSRNIKNLESIPILTNPSKKLKTELLQTFHNKEKFLQFVLLYSFRNLKLQSFVKFLFDNRIILQPILDKDLLVLYKNYITGYEDEEKYFFLNTIVQDKPLFFELKYLYTFGSLDNMKLLVLMNIQEFKNFLTNEYFEFISTFDEAFEIEDIQDKEKKLEFLKTFILQDPNAMENFKNKYSRGL